MTTKEFQEAIKASIERLIQRRAMPCIQSVEHDSDGDTIFKFQWVSTSPKDDGAKLGGGYFVVQREKGPRPRIECVIPGIYQAAGPLADIHHFLHALVLSGVNGAGAHFRLVQNRGLFLGTECRLRVDLPIVPEQFDRDIHDCLRSIVQMTFAYRVALWAMEAKDFLDEDILQQKTHALHDKIADAVGADPYAIADDTDVV